jgi:hypothetical protein
MGNRREAYRILVKTDLLESDNFEDLDIDGRVILQ